MLIEQLIFVIIAFAIFVYMFFKMMKMSDISYVIVLILQAIGIALNFLEVLLKINLNLFFIILKYFFSIIIPVSIIAFEKKGNTLAETYSIMMVKIFIN